MLDSMPLSGQYASVMTVCHCHARQKTLSMAPERGAVQPSAAQRCQLPMPMLPPPQTTATLLRKCT